MIRMIATDLDGTLLGAKSVLPEENVRALQRAMEAGVKVVLASGRMVEATTPIGAAIGVNAPMVLFNGAMVYDPASGEILHGSCIPRDTAVEVLREIEARGCYVQAFPGRGYFFERHTEHTVLYQNKISVVGSAVGKKLSDWLETDVSLRHRRDVFSTITVSPSSSVDSISISAGRLLIASSSSVSFTAPLIPASTKPRSNLIPWVLQYLSMFCRCVSSPPPFSACVSVETLQ